jgi:hypothetical protein
MRAFLVPSVHTPHANEAESSNADPDISDVVGSVVLFLQLTIDRQHYKSGSQAKPGSSANYARPQEFLPCLAA